MKFIKLVTWADYSSVYTSKCVSKHSHSIKAHYSIIVLYGLYQNTVHCSLYDFKVAVISTNILLEVLSEYTRKPNYAGRTCMRGKEMY